MHNSITVSPIVRFADIPSWPMYKRRTLFYRRSLQSLSAKGERVANIKNIVLLQHCQVFRICVPVGCCDLPKVGSIESEEDRGQSNEVCEEKHWFTNTARWWRLRRTVSWHWWFDLCPSIDCSGYTTQPANDRANERVNKRNSLRAAVWVESGLQSNKVHTQSEDTKWRTRIEQQKEQVKWRNNISLQRNWSDQ